MASEGRNLVGVDIGSSAIKVCEIRSSRGSRRLVRFGYHPLSAEAIVEGEIINAGAIVEGLERLFHKSKQRNVALRAGGHSVIIKKITVPQMTSAELSEQIGWEATQHIPFDVAEVQLDYEVLRGRPEHGQMDVMLVAAKKQEISDLTNLITQARLRPVVVDVDAFAVQNAFEIGYGAPPTDETVVLLHIGAALTTLNILADGTTAFTRDIPLGGNAITEAIQRGLGIERDQAEAYKCGGDGRGVVPHEVSTIIEQVVEQVAAEIQRSLDFYLATSPERQLRRIYVSGGSANLRALLDAIQRRVASDPSAGNLQVETFDSLRVAEPDPKFVDPMSLVGRSAQAAVAMGLALRKERERRG